VGGPLANPPVYFFQAASPHWFPSIRSTSDQETWNACQNASDDGHQRFGPRIGPNNRLQLAHDRKIPRNLLPSDSVLASNWASGRSGSRDAASSIWTSRLRKSHTL